MERGPDFAQCERFYATESKLNPELMDKAQALVRIENIGRVKAIKEQDVPTIQQCFPPENGKH